MNNNYNRSGAARLTPVTAAAALDEMRFWVRIMAEHAKFIRGGVDPTEEAVFRKADFFVREFERLRVAVNAVDPGNFYVIQSLIGEVVPATVALRNFKSELFIALSNCEAVAQLPAPLLDHVRREADFFLNNIDIVLGRPGATRALLGIPDGGMPARVLPRLMIPYAGRNILEVARDENLFHLRIQEEHGEVLLLIAYRPQIQEMLYRETAKFEKRLEELRDEAEGVPLKTASLLRFNEKVWTVMDSWRSFLRQLHRDVVDCKVPSGQINAPALILDHMAREVEYYMSVLEIVGNQL